MDPIGPNVQRVLGTITPDPFTQVAILRVWHNAAGHLAAETNRRLTEAYVADDQEARDAAKAAARGGDDDGAAITSSTVHDAARDAEEAQAAREGIR